MPNPGRQGLIVVGVLFLLTTVGTAGYVLLERMSFLDALYMTVTTISTVGFREVEPLDSAGKVFTIALIVTGVATAFYGFSTVAGLVLEGHLGRYLGRTVMTRTIEQLERHVVICGFGRFGRVVAEELHSNGVPLVVVDSDPAKGPELTRSGMPYLIGSVLEDDVLERAGVRRARAIVVGTGSDPDNVFVTLSAREKNPTIRVHARGESEGGLRRLELAGADQVVSAYHTGGLRMAAAILRPAVVDFLELALPGRGEEIDLEEIRIDGNAWLVGRTISALEQEMPRLRVIAIKRRNEPIRLIPEPATSFADGDHLVVIGDRRDLGTLAQRAQAAAER